MPSGGILSLSPLVRRSRQPALPSSLAGLVAWGEGSDLGSDGSGIASWLNKTGSGLDAAQGTSGNRPTVKANAINGQKAAQFTAASSHYLQFSGAALNWFQNIGGATLAMVVQPTTVPSSQVNLLTIAVNASASARLSWFKRTTTNLYSAVVRSNDATAVIVDTATAATAGAPVILSATFDCANGPIADYVNGAGMGSGTVNPVQSLPNTASHDITLGASGTPSGFFDGYLAAYALWNVAYTRAQLAGVLLRWSLLYNIPLTG